MSPTPNIDPTILVILCNYIGGGGRIIDRQCCNNCHLPRVFIQISIIYDTISSQIDDKEKAEFWPMDELAHHPWHSLILVHKKCHPRSYRMTLNITSSVLLRAGLDYVEEVHWSRNLGEWSNMIGYKMGSSRADVNTTTKTPLVKNSKQEWKTKKLHGWKDGNFLFYFN